MKVRFGSQKEKDPTREGGLRVLYAPGKRAAFRIRWYLILALVSAPFFWFLFKLLSGLLLLDVPARLMIPATEVRSLETGTVAEVLIEAGDRVGDGAALIRLENDALSLQLAQLPDIADENTADQSAQTVIARRQATLEQRVERAAQRVEELERLVARGAATVAEVRAAQDQRDTATSDLLAYQQSLGQIMVQNRDQQRQSAQQARQTEDTRAVIEARLGRLQVTAPHEGRIASVEVTAGESVGPGTLVAQILPDQIPELQIYLPAQYADLAEAGQALDIRFPDGQWQAATVTSLRPELQRLPPDLRGPLGGDQPHLVLTAQTTEPLPERWRRNNVPLTARFPNWFERHMPW